MESTSGLWTHLIQPVFERLQRLGVGMGAPVLILTDGTMGMLPIHVAWRFANGRRRYLIDDFIILFAPSAFAYASSRRHLDARQYVNPSLLAVVDSRQDLTYARLESELIADTFPADYREALRGDDVRPLTVITKAKNKSHVHFACHGFYAWGDPMRSGLLMAYSWLALWEVIYRMDLSQSRLVTLSACESALIDAFDAPQEFTGLPAGFIQAGAPGVVGTFWNVDDLSTMLLMRRFYELLVQLNQSPAVSLREAQLWLRGLTKDDAMSELKRVKPSTTTSEFEIKDDELPSGPFPFDHPYYWAAFALHGT